MTMKDLTPKQRRFVAEYIVDLNATQAAIRAGYAKGATARVQGARLLTNANVVAEIAKKQGKVLQRVELSAENTLEELRRIVHFDPAQIYDENGALRPIRELPPEVRACIASVEVNELFQVSHGKRKVIGQVSKIKFWNKMDAVTKAMQHFDLMAATKIDHRGEVVHRVENMSEDERAARAVALLLKTGRTLPKPANAA